MNSFIQCCENRQKDDPPTPVQATKDRAQMEQALKVLQIQENSLRYDRFGNAEVIRLGVAAAALAEEYDRGVGIAITRESDGLVLFQYMMEDKAPRNLEFIAGKRRAVLASGHCSVWLQVENAVNGKWQELIDQKPHILTGGGAFPIRVDGKLVATISVSGLHEGKDHELVVRALCRALDMQVPMLPCTVR